MKNRDILARFHALDARLLSQDNPLSVLEQNERLDCEIALGMVDCRPETRAEAARRVVAFAEDREYVSRNRLLLRSLLPSSPLDP